MMRLITYLLSQGLLGRGAAARRQAVLRLIKTIPPAQLAKALGVATLIVEAALFVFLAPRLLFLRTPVGLALAIGGMIWSHKIIMRVITRKLGLTGPGPRVVGQPDDPRVINVTARRDRGRAAGQADADDPGQRLLGYGPSRARRYYEDRIQARIRRLNPVTYYTGLAGIYLLIIIILVLVQVFWMD